MSLEAIILPLHYENSAPFIRLVGALGNDVDAATGRYVRLFQRLVHAVNEGKRMGFVEPEDVGMFTARVGVPMSQLAEPVGLLAARPDGSFYCAAFVTHCGTPTIHQNSAAGGKIKHFNRRVESGLARLAGDSIFIIKERLVDAAGQPLAREVIDRLRRLVINCDAALGKMERGDWEYSEQLIQSALRVLPAYRDEEINAVCRVLCMKKGEGHPLLAGLNTETLLAPVTEGGRTMFDEVLERLAIQVK